MSAAAKPWKAQDHDRRSNMVTSSVNAHAKKDGAGGSYTWGSAMDVTDYMPVGLPNSTNVITVAAATAPAPAVVQSMPPAAITDTQQFPTLVAQPVASPVTSTRWSAPAPAVYQAPPVQTAPAVSTATAPKTYTTISQAPAMRMATTTGVATSVSIPPFGSHTSMVSTAATAGWSAGAGAPRVILGEDMMRSGVTTLDSTHPRNAFARKPHHKPFAGGTAPAVELQEAPAIDWTAAGTTSFQHQVIHQVAQNPAHLGPYIAEKPGVALSTLKAMPNPAVYVPNPRMSKAVASQPKTAKPQVMFQRKC